MDSNSRAYEFVMGFVDNSERYRSQFVDKWEEVVANFIVEPDWKWPGRERSPYQYGHVYRSRKNQIILKDPETHKLVMSYASKLVRTLYGDPRYEFVQARPVGYEDAGPKSSTVTRLLRYSFGLPGHFRTLVESIVDMLLFGTSIVEVGWAYEQKEMPVRSLDMTYGVETDTTTRMMVPSYDDVIIRPLDIMDFYPDPGRYRLQEMSGAAKRFKMNAGQAKRMVDSGIYSSSGVRDASYATSTSEPRSTYIAFREGLDLPTDADQMDEFKDMIGYEYWGEVPWEDGGSSRRVITVLNNVVVRNDPYPLADRMLPFHSFIINPIQGRFYGISPAEVVRYDQSFADAIKILLAEAIIRQVHPPIAYDHSGDIDLSALKAWRADALIGVNGGPNSIGTIRYDANVQNGFAMLTGLKVGIQEASGALGAIQGEPGPDREAATVGVQRMQFAMDRPELAAMVLEKECLPPIGRAILARYQQFLSDTQDLKIRIGEQPDPVWLGDIMGDFDVQFVGSRMVATRQTKLQAYDRLISMANAVPPLAAMIPWDQIGRELVGEILELPEVAAKIADPLTMMRNAMMMQMLGPGGGKNQLPTSSEPPGAMPQQMMGAPGEAV